MKGAVKLENTGEKLIKEEWLKSPERQEAWLKFTAKQFDQSQEFASARHAFRRRINEPY